MTTTKKKPAAKKKAAAPAKPKPKKKAAPAAAKSKWTDPAYLAAYDSETMFEVTKRSREILRLRDEHEIAHAKAAALKKEWQSKTEARELYMRERDAVRGKDPGSLFADAEHAETMKAAAAHAEKQQAAQVNPAEPRKGASVVTDWFPEHIHQKFPLDQMKKYGLRDGDITALADGKCKTGGDFGPIDTVGRLQEYMTPGSTGWQRHLADLVGVGPAAVKRIEDALIRFWADWPAIANDFAVSLGYKPPAGGAKAAEPKKAAPKKKPAKKGKANANGKKSRPGSKGGDRPGDGQDGDGEHGSSGDAKPSPGEVADKLINDLADSTAVPAADPGEI